MSITGEARVNPTTDFRRERISPPTKTALNKHHLSPRTVVGQRVEGSFGVRRLGS